jgi:copper homeostasis protein
LGTSAGTEDRTGQLHDERHLVGKRHGGRVEGHGITSGQEASVLEGLDLITTLVRKAGDRITIMPGGGITERNIAKIVAQSGVREVHLVGTTSVPSQMQYRNQHVFMGGELRPPEYSRQVTDPNRIQTFVQLVTSS